ncbi:MAG: T9SS type A sorting domain-containing protein [Bacteroidetes bacterium]|nr:MAG: T9SS type A sorting domain-containing protein [Bacteroidota bacterium]
MSPRVRPVLARVILYLSLTVTAAAQGTYYNSIDTSLSTFVTDLHNLIYPHTKISYNSFEETNVANYASRDTTGGQRVVTCVYSGYQHVYTPPFAWGLFSREHTWCHSWMPTHPSESGPEYADQHHLFPTHQNNANGRRSNHPLGLVSSVDYQFLDGKLGTNGAGETVYEPRASQKGDAARALFYMAVCYNGVSGNDWTFNALNNTRLPSLSEAPQSVELLLQWHDEDPPDAWEKGRNDYIYSIQGNRNPFVDHPEYADIIDFNTLTKKTASAPVLADEPTNYPAGYGTPTLASTSITVTWTDASGAVPPTGYLLMANTSGTFTDPTDGTAYADDTALGDGSAQVNVAQGTQSCTFTGLTPSTNYSFKLVPYNGAGSARNYRTASFPSALVQTYATSAGSGSSSTTDISSITYSYHQDFDTLAATGTTVSWTNNSTIEGWYLNKTSYTVGTGSSNTGAVYSYGSSGAAERALGSAASSGSGTLFYAVKFTNSSGRVITRLPVQYAGEQWRNGGNTTGQSLTFEYKVNASGIDDASGWTAVPALNFTGPVATGTAAALDGNASGNRSTVSAVITVTVQPGETVWLRWTDLNDSGNDHGLAVDDFWLNINGEALPAELTSFTARAAGRGAELRWSTASETDNLGFEVERRELNRLGIGTLDQSTDESMHQWSRIAFIPGHGTTNAPHAYSYVDPSASGTVQYRLKQLDRDGSFAYSGTVEFTAPVPVSFSLAQNSPNPFNPSTRIRFTLPAAAPSVLTVHNALGQQVAVLAQGMFAAGRHTVPFDASHLAGGIYFARLSSGTRTAVIKMTLLK